MDHKNYCTTSALQRWASDTPERPAFIFLDSKLAETETLCFGTLSRRVRAVAAVIGDRVSPGDRVLLTYPPGLDFAVALFACFSAGVIAVPAPMPRGGNRDGQTSARLAGMVADCLPSLILTTSEQLEILQGLHDEIPVLATDTVPEALARGWRERTPDDTEIAFLQYTSGSTGKPKGVKVTHRNLAANLRIIDQTVQHDREGSIVNWLPHFHDMGLIGNCIYPMVIGTTCYVMSPVTFVQRPIRWLQAISKYRAKTSGAPNFAYDYCVQRTNPKQREALDLSCWELAFSGAERIRDETLERFTETFAPHGFKASAFFGCYGLAESTLIVTGGTRHAGPVRRSFDQRALAEGRLCTANGEKGLPLVGSGRPQLGLTTIIFDPDTGLPLPQARVGEILVSGPSVTDGYWGDNDAMPGFVDLEVGGSTRRFLRTGDLGALFDGELFVTSRLKDLIIIDGRNHHPEDIESTVEQGHSSILPGRCAAFSADINGTERLIVAVELKRDAPPANTLLSAMREMIAQHHNLPLHDLLILAPGELPRTTSGKLRRRACQADYLARTFSEAVS